MHAIFGDSKPIASDRNTVFKNNLIFQPVLCYMEGMWTESTKGKMTEPFESDRHKIDADSFHDLQVRSSQLLLLKSKTGLSMSTKIWCFMGLWHEDCYCYCHYYCYQKCCGFWE